MTDVITVQSWLDSFPLHEPLRPHLTKVMLGLPEHVRLELMHDPAFVLYDYEPHPTAGTEIPLRMIGGKSGRSVVLKRTLTHRPEPFIRWVIAHELAHAHLRNRGRTITEDPEHAADALAAMWGFPKPPRGGWGG